LKETAPTPVTAVFDIGKTNKKFLLFDRHYEAVHEQFTKMEEAADTDDDGHACENLEYLVKWIREQFDAVLQNDKFKVEGLNFSTYGASLVHLDEDGEVITPFYDYLKPYPEKLLNQFYESYGGEKQFALETASPPMGMLNSGLQLYWLKHKKPDLFKNISRSLHFPQYLSSLFTEHYTSEFTSIGCHTGLWNYQDQKYHRWVEAEDVLRLFPEIKPVTGSREVQYKKSTFKAGHGIHDSSAALTPYFLAMDEPFLLVSTGTWSATLNAFNDDPLTFEELKRDCLCFMNIYGDHVKAARLFLGNEYQHQKKKLDNHFGGAIDDEKFEPDSSVLKKLIKDDNADKKLQLETAHTSGPFPAEDPGEWDVRQFSSYSEAYHQLMLDLVAMQAASLQLAEGSESITNIIVTGGFSKSALFLELLASRFPKKEIYTASLSHASALGAAMALDDTHAKNEAGNILKLKYHKGLPDLDIESYRWSSAPAL
jgi:sugar (pentulose or hexulose) kinase